MLLFKDRLFSTSHFGQVKGDFFISNKSNQDDFLCNNGLRHNSTSQYPRYYSKQSTEIEDDGIDWRPYSSKPS